MFTSIPPATANDWLGYKRPALAVWFILQSSLHLNQDTKLDFAWDGMLAWLFHLPCYASVTPTQASPESGLSINPVLRVCFQGTWPITPVKSLVKWLLHKSLKEFMFKITKSYKSWTFWITMIRWKRERYIWNGKDLLFVYVHIKERSCWKKMKPAQIGQFFLSCFSNYAFIPIGEYTGGFILLNMLEKNIFILKHNKSILEKTTKLKWDLKNKYQRKLMLVGKGGKQVEGEDIQLHLLGH